MARNLEIGPGKYPRGHPLEWELFDIHDWEWEGYRSHIGDARNLPFEANTFGQVYSSQTLEHFGRLETGKVLREWLRVARDYLILDLPDIMGMVHDYLGGENSFDQFVERVYGTQDYDGNTHYTMFHIGAFPDLVRKELGDAAKIKTIYPQHEGGGFHVELAKCF